VRASARDLARLAAGRGVQLSYRNWRGRRARVAAGTLAAILDALGEPEPPAAAGPAASVAASPAGGMSAAPGAAEAPAAPAVRQRMWGFTVQLYSLRSRRSWGMGDLRDLADLARWSAANGAGFVLVNPLHAPAPVLPVSPSPYLPATRRYVSPLYLRIEDVPEYARLPADARRRIEALAAPLRDRSVSAALIDYDAVWEAKRRALELIHDIPLPADRRDAFERFRRSEGAALEDWATWCAIAGEHGPDWRRWPPGLAGPRSGEVRHERQRHAGATGFHSWLQWLLDEQLAAAQQAAVAAGMPAGVITDLAVGADPGGADAWAHQHVLVRGVSTGAPPDVFNQRGQDWAQPPWHPQRLAAAGYRPLAGLIDAALRHSGGVRIDHVMGLFRLWWVPDGMTPDRGAYVRYDQEAMTAVVAAAAARRGALVIGEDLGTVGPSVRRVLAARGILGTSMLWFERMSDGSPRPAGRWRRDCLACIGTHDMPPAASYLTGDHVSLRSRLGLLTRPEEEERREAAQSVTGWRRLLSEMGLLSGCGGEAADAAGTGPPAPGALMAEGAVREMTVALYRFLARTPARLIGISLPDATGDRRPQNLPGTSDEYPNWRIPLTGADGEPVLLEDLRAHPGVAAVIDAVR
jgi:4-alpha-glucanotransferase